ncbi:DUF881 domain-containing protein [Cellulosimicrobium marinum]|uniref:DUF881 domain-containing protein n=1 Tax=Cellulosimicrobium marinum TaxID=1638992 RepID=UPI001E54A6F8|nr:DUF881 domain-containing protein [Cellulosimicrobium marinum]MCB7137541.1 DUF881 domain-containing protein [Cellulosimicrobium marinum]
MSEDRTSEGRAGDERAGDERTMARRGPVDASMTLLNEVMHRPLDPGYAAAAARRAEAGASRRGRGGTVLLVVVAAGLGIVTTAAAVDLRAPEPAVLAARQTLEQEITDRQADADALATRSTELSGEIEGLQDEALGDLGGDVLADLQQEGVLTGSQAVEGPGVVVTLDDASASLDSDVETGSLVQDRDLQRVVNALWSGGAEAVAINDQRLTGLSAIRSAGDAILVDLQPLVPPYHVEAVGDADAMRTALVRSGASDYLRLIGTQYGIRSSVTAQSRLDLPGRATPTLYFAHVPGSTVDSEAPSTGEDVAPDDVPADQGSTSTPQSTPETPQESVK